MAIPELPKSLHDHSMSAGDLSSLWQSVIVELMDPEYTGRTHGNRRTYDAGCKGPACSKASREHGRRRTQTAPNERYKYLDPIIDFYTSIATIQIQEARESILSKLIS